MGDELGLNSEAQHQQRVLAGQGRFAQMVRESLEAHPEDLGKAAQHLSRKMRKHGLRYHYGITVKYMEAWAQRLGLWGGG